MRNDDFLALLRAANELRQEILGFQDIDLHVQLQSGQITR